MCAGLLRLQDSERTHFCFWIGHLCKVHAQLSGRGLAQWLIVEEPAKLTAAMKHFAVAQPLILYTAVHVQLSRMEAKHAFELHLWQQSPASPG